MTSGSSAPADTRMMGIVHDALRRDLTRTTVALSGLPAPGDAQRVAIAQHVDAMMSSLRVHHGGEDAWLWPTVRRLNPGASELLDRMDADHDAVGPHIGRVMEAAAGYRDSATGRASLVEALEDLRSTLDPHLRLEEDEMMPVVASALTRGEWDAWQQEYYVTPKSKRDLGMEGHWLIDGGDRAVYDHVVGTVNPVLRFFLVRAFGPAYRKACAARWGAGVPVGPNLGEAPTADGSEVIGTARRPWRTRGEVSMHIDAPADQLYDLVADLGSAQGRSEEVEACLWIEGPPPGTVGSRFRGRNRAGLIRWSRVCEVVTANRGEQFVFRTVPERFDPSRRDSCIWGYRFEPEGAGTLLTHYYRIVRPPSSGFLVLYGILMPQHRDARPALRHTLEQLSAAVAT